MPTVHADQIDPPLDAVRKRPAPIEADAELQRSIAALGILQPLLVRAQGNRFVLIKGGRRLRCAIAAGLTEVPVMVFGRADEGACLAAGAAATMARAPLDPLDQWRAVVELQRQGYSLDAASDALGLSPRRAQQLDRLGRLAPEVLALIGEWGMPDWDDLADIARAEPKVQATAVGQKGLVVKARVKDDTDQFDWDRVARACEDSRKRLPRTRALFDVTAMEWDEDIFAEPGSAEQFTTADVARFRQLQLAALKADVARRLKEKQRVQLVECDKWGAPSLPKGWDMRSTGPQHAIPAKPPSGTTLFLALDDDGQVHWCGAIDRAAEAKKEKERQKLKAAKPAATASSPAADADSDDETSPAEEDGEPDAAPDKSPFSKDGQKLLAIAKTEALAARLRDRTFCENVTYEDIIAMLVLALHADNVEVRGYAREYPDARGADLLARLVTPEGHLKPTEPPLAEIACETLARCLFIDPPDAERSSYIAASGPAAEWIGAAIHAADALPRFDTEAFLATMNGASMRAVGEGVGLKLKNVAALRKEIAGHAPDWRPLAAQFGAPGPKPKGGA